MTWQMSTMRDAVLVLHIVALAISIGAAILWIVGPILLYVWRGRYPRLTVAQENPSSGAILPALSIIVPACNEAGTVEVAMRSLLALDYPDLQIVAVDDRSTDDTGAILDRLAAAHSS